MQDERVTAIIDNLSSLIVHHSRLTAVEQYTPRSDADMTDDLIAEHKRWITEHKRWITELRDIRQRFENLVTGVIE